MIIAPDVQAALSSLASELKATTPRGRRGDRLGSQGSCEHEVHVLHYVLDIRHTP